MFRVPVRFFLDLITVDQLTRKLMVLFKDLKELSEESKKVIESEGLGIAEHFVDLGYEYWTSGKNSTLSGKTPGCGIGN